MGGDRAVVDRPAAAGDAARFETVTREYCNAARGGDDGALCRGEDGLHGADLRAGTLFDRRTFASEAELRVAVELSRNLAAPVVLDPPPLASADTERERRRVLLRLPRLAARAEDPVAVGELGERTPEVLQTLRGQREPRPELARLAHVALDLGADGGRARGAVELVVAEPLGGFADVAQTLPVPRAKGCWRMRPSGFNICLIVSSEMKR